VDRDQEIDRLLALGAHRVDIGQTAAESWAVLVGPEGNEFCVVRPKERALPDPDLVEQRAAVRRGLLVVPDPGGDEHGL
jgi:Glyoxalase-like domain